jgi:uroporphyrinogen decarboxylase
VFDAVRACKRALADRVPLIGFCGAPFTTLSYLVEGQTSREFERIKGMIFSAPAVFAGLMENMTTLLCEYLRGQVLAGADALQIFDSWAGALAPADYRAHVLPHLSRLVQFTRGLGVPTHPLRPRQRQPPRPGRRAPRRRPRRRLVDRHGPGHPRHRPDRVVQGNLDPMALLGPPRSSSPRPAIVAAGRRAKAHIFNLGHGISRHTDPAIARHLVQVVHAASALA